MSTAQQVNGALGQPQGRRREGAVDWRFYPFRGIDFALDFQAGVVLSILAVMDAVTIPCS